MDQLTDHLPMAGENDSREIAASPLASPKTSGNSYLAAGALATAGLAAMAVNARPARAVTPALTFANIPGTGDIKVLNYALALEDLEADLYAQALMRLTTGGTNALGTVIPPLGRSVADVDVKYVAEFATVESDHRDFLRSAITAKVGAAQTIKPFKYNFGIEAMSRQKVIETVYDAELTGVGAYLGAIVHFATKDYLPVAGAIQGTEARHTAVFANILHGLFSETTLNGKPLVVAPLANQTNGIDQPLTPDAVLAHVSPFIVVQAQA